MAKILIKLYGNNTLIGEYTHEDLISYDYDQMATSNSDVPIFDIYPSLGTLTIQDKDLSLYNKAMSGFLDFPQYKVELYINNNLAITSLVYERPKYSFADKSLTITLGDILDKANELTFSGYKYPLEAQNISVIFQYVLKAYLPKLTESDIVNMLNGQYSSTKTFLQHMQEIVLTYPYLPQKSYREAFKNILTVCGLSMITDEKCLPKLVSVDGSYYGIEDKIIAITPDKITDNFIPSVLLQNKYNVCDVDYKIVSLDYRKAGNYYSYELPSTISKQTTNITKDNKSNQGSQYYDTAAIHVYGSCVYLELNTITYKQNKVPIPDNTNNNLYELLSFETENKKGFLSLTLEKTIKRQKGTVTIKATNTSQEISRLDPATFVADTSSDIEIVSTEYLQVSELSKSESFTYPEINKYPAVTATLKYDDTTFNIIEKGSNTKFSHNYLIDLGKTLTAIGAYWQANGRYLISDMSTEAYKYFIAYTFVKIQISYMGNFIEISFNDDTLNVKLLQYDYINKCNLNNGGELLQYVAGSDESDGLPYKLGKGTLSAFNQGLQNGTLSCMGYDYYKYNRYPKTVNKDVKYIDYTTYNNSSNNQKALFEIGDLVVPCKTNSGTPYITRSNTASPYEVVKRHISINSSGTVNQTLGLRELVYLAEIKELKTFIKYTLTNVTADDKPEYLTNLKDETIIFKPAEGYKLPKTIEVILATYYWDYKTGELVLKHDGGEYFFVGVTIAAVPATEYIITTHLTNITQSIDPLVVQKIGEDETKELTFTANTNYTLPNTIIVTNVEYYDWDKTTGKLTISNAFDDVDIYITAKEAGSTAYSIGYALKNVTGTNLPSSISSSEILTITFTASPASKYSLPAQIDVTGADYLWNNVSGELKLFNAKSDVSIYIVGKLLEDTYQITYKYLENITAQPTPQYISKNQTIDLVLTANTGSKLPTSVTVLNASHTWDYETGALTIFNATGNVAIIATAISLTAYNVVYNISGASFRQVPKTSITEGETIELTVDPETASYSLPATIPETNATVEWSVSNNVGSLKISNPTGTVTITIIATKKQKLATPQNVLVFSYMGSWDEVEHAEKYALYIDDVKVGEYIPTTVTYTIGAIITNGEGDESNPTSIEKNGTATLKYIPANGYELPDTITVKNATLTNWNKTTGTAVISNPTDNVVIEIDMKPKEYSITLNLTGFTSDIGNPTTIATNEQKSLSFTLNDGYEFPESNPTVTGASFVSWSSSGVLVIKNPTANVTITITATALPAKLATPTNITVDGTTVSWDEVTNATSYDIYVDNVVYETISEPSPSNIITVSTTKEGAYSTSIVNETFMPQVGDRLAQWIAYWGERGLGYQPYFGFNVYSNDTFNANNASVDFSNVTTDQNGNAIAINDYVYWSYCGWTSSNRLISGSINALTDVEASNILILVQGYNKAISIADSDFDMQYGTINCTVPEDVQLPFNFIFAVKGDYNTEFTIIDSDDNLFGSTTAIIAALPNKFVSGGDTSDLGTLTITNQNIVTSGSPLCAAVISKMLENEISNSMDWVIPAGISTLQNQITVSNFSFGGYGGQPLSVYIITMQVVTFTIKTCVNQELEQYTDCQGPANMLFSEWLTSSYNTLNITYPVTAEECAPDYIPMAVPDGQTITDGVTIELVAYYNPTN